MKLSLAIITGNIGGKLMSRFLDNFLYWVDEVVVVRAIGNQAPDESLEIAKERGCIVCEYRNKHDWPHVDDFAAARNQAWSMATGDWVMWADTDDIISKSDAEAIRELLETKGDKFDMLITPYCVPDAGLGDNPRERVVRRGIARWVQPVHECLEPIENGQKWRTARCDARIVHDPGPRPPAARNGRNLRILQSVPESEMTTSLWYHLFAEHFAMGNKVDGAKAAEAFLMRADAGENERFECMLSMSMVTDDVNQKAAWLQMAWHECPHRREPLVLLSNIAQNAGKLALAQSYLRAASGLPLPEKAPWNLRRKMWGWQFVQEEARILRGQGNFAKADAIEFNHFKRNGGKISLLHATRGRAQQAIDCRALWLDRAENADAIEHIFACDPDDEQGPLLGGFRHIVQDAGRGPCGAWNMAATIANGEIFVQVSDDMVPPMGWDRLIIEAIGDTSRPAVLRVSDGHRKDGLIVLAIVTREWWKQHGYLFHPAFFSMYSDNWLTECAEKQGATIEAPDIVFEHRHPVFTGEAMHATTAQSNRLLHYATGKKILEQLREGKQPFTWQNIPTIGVDTSPVELHERIISSLDAPRCVEVGVALGRGLMCMATLAEFRGGYAIGYDTFEGTKGESIEYPANMEDECWRYRNLCEVNASLVKSDSVIASALFDLSPEYVFLDAAHDYESVKADIAAWWPLVTKGGWLAGHDYTNSDGVRRAVDEAFPDAQKHGTCWYIQKK